MKLTMDRRLETWVAQGEMDIERIFDGMNKALSGFLFDTSEARQEIRSNFAVLCSDINGMPRLTEIAFRPFLYD